MFNKSRLKYIILFALFMLPIFIAPVTAHGYIVRAIPEDRSAFTRPPARLQYWFSEALEPNFSELNVRNQQGEIIASGGVADNDSSLMSVRLPADLPEGAYIVELRPAFASDGHVVAESRVFFIGSAIGGINGQAASNTARPLEVVWRAVVFVSTMVLFSTFIMYALVFVPAWGNQHHTAGLLPPRVMSRLNWIIGITLITAILGNTLALIQQTMIFFNIGFSQALDPDFWSLVRIGSRFGDIWNARMVFLTLTALMFAGSLFLRKSQPESVRAFLTASAWVMALVLGTLSVLSHAAGSLLNAWVGIFVDWLHVLGVGFWAGGLVVLILVLPVALAPYDAENRRLALLAVLRRFSRIATLAVVLVIATGIYSASNWVFGSDELQSTFGMALIAKGILASGLIGVGALHHLSIKSNGNHALPGLSLSNSLHLESLLVIIVLLAAAQLTATPVPTPEFAQNEVEAPSAEQTVNGLTYHITLSPGGPGINTYDTRITSATNTAAIDNLQINLQLIYPERDIRGERHIAEAVESGLYVTVGDDIDRVGHWWMLLNVTDENNQKSRVAFEWDISDDAAVIQSITPSIVHIMAFFGVILSILWVLYPFARWSSTKLSLDAGSVTVAISAPIITAIVLAITFGYLNSSRQNYEAAFYPVPEMMNTILPDETSLKQGESLYREHCLIWQSSPREFGNFRDRLQELGDDELFKIISDGWRGLPPCEGEIDAESQWHIVNFLRTLER